MKNGQAADVAATKGDCEFVPPIDLPETWGLAWDRQLGAALAWQAVEAGPNGETEMCGPAQKCFWPDCDAQRDGAGADSAVGVATFRTLTGMNALLGSLRERLLQIHSETLDVAGDEITQSYVETAGTVGGSEMRPLHPENARRLNELAGRWFEALAAAQTEMTVLTGIPSNRTLAASMRRPPANGPISSSQSV